jgi:hypothetical protein
MTQALSRVFIRKRVPLAPVMGVTRLNTRRGVVVLARSCWRCGERHRLECRPVPGSSRGAVVLVKAPAELGETYAVRELIHCLWARGVLDVADEGVRHRLGA